MTTARKIEVGLIFKTYTGARYKIIDQISDQTFLGKRTSHSDTAPVFVKYWDTGAIWEEGHEDERLNFTRLFGVLGRNLRLQGVEI